MSMCLGDDDGCSSIVTHLAGGASLLCSRTYNNKFDQLDRPPGGETSVQLGSLPLGVHRFVGRSDKPATKHGGSVYTAIPDFDQRSDPSANSRSDHLVETRPARLDRDWVELF